MIFPDLEAIFPELEAIFPELEAIFPELEDIYLELEAKAMFSVFNVLSFSGGMFDWGILLICVMCRQAVVCVCVMVMSPF